MPLTFTPQQKGELATAYACMILGDCKVTINEENVSKILKAASIQVEPFLPKLFCQLLKGKDLMEMFANVGGGGGAVGGGGGAGGAAEGGEGEKKEEKKEEEEEDDGGFDFSDDD